MAEKIRKDKEKEKDIEKMLEMSVTMYFYMRANILYFLKGVHGSFIVTFHKHKINLLLSCKMWWKLINFHSCYRVTYKNAISVTS